MPNINLPTGNTIYVSVYEYYFVLTDEQMEQFFQSCIADNLGVYIDNPFSNTGMTGKLEMEERLEVEELASVEEEI